VVEAVSGLGIVGLLAVLAVIALCFIGFHRRPAAWERLAGSDDPAPAQAKGAAASPAE